MRKIYILSVLVLFAVSAFAQRQYGVVKNMPAQEMSFSKYPLDTLVPGNMANVTGFTLYGSSGGGYALGCNAYGDYAKGEAFEVAADYNIYGAIYWFGGKTEVTGAGTVAMEIRAMDGTTGYTSAGDGDQPCPGTLLISDVVAIDSIDTSSYFDFATAYIHTFSSIVNISDDYYIGFDVEICYPDTIGLVSTVDGDGAGWEMVWEKWSTGEWNTFHNGNWHLDIDAVIIPIAEFPGGIVENNFINGLKMSTYPNPAVNNVTLSYELQNNAEKVLVRVLDVTGKVVEHMNLGSQNAGVYTIDMDVTNYAAGTYYYLVNAGAARMAIKMNITK